MWNPVDSSSFIFDRNRYQRSASEQTHIVTTHEYHSYRRTESPCQYRNYSEDCLCINCRRYRQPSYRHHMSRQQTSTFIPGRRQGFYSSAHSIRDELRRGSPTGIGISINSHRQYSPQLRQYHHHHHQQQQQQQQHWRRQRQEQQKLYRPYHFHDMNEYEYQRYERLFQINRRNTREVQPNDQLVPSAANTSRQDEAVIKRR